MSREMSHRAVLGIDIFNILVLILSSVIFGLLSLSFKTNGLIEQYPMEFISGVFVSISCALGVPGYIINNHKKNK